jgi:nitric oxide reductase activation protein
MSAMIGAGSLNGDVMRELGARSNLTRRYLAIEGRRALAALSRVIPPSVLPDPGPLPADAAATDSPAASLELARGKVRVPDAPAWFGELRPKRVDVEDATSQTAMKLNVDDLNVDDPVEDDEESERGDEGKRKTKVRTSPFGDNALSRAFQKMFGSGFSGAEAEGGAEMKVSRARMSALRKGTLIKVDEPIAVPASALTGPHGNLYPEWDEHKQLYREAYCAVVEYLPGPHELAPLDRPARHEALRRELGRLGLGPRRTRKQRIGYDLDLDAAVDAQTVIATGHTPADTVYVDNLRHSRELGVLVLLDASGSGEERTAEGETVFELQRRVTAALVDTLTGLGDRVASYAFRSEGRQVSFSRLKGFDEEFTSTTLHRIGGVQPGGFTRFGGAIRHATHLLLDEGGTPRRLLVVISDGFPYDHGYERSYAEGDARKALDEARASGVGCLCLNIGSSTAPEALARIYARTEYATAADLEELTPSMLRLFHGALRTADLRRRYGADQAARLSA